MLVSLGSRCEIRYQTSLRRARAANPEITIDAFRALLFAHQRAAFDPGSLYFDWLITPIGALIHALEHDFAGMFERADLEPFDGAVRHRRHDIIYRHHFTATGGAVTEATIDAEHPQQRAKLDHLAEQTLAVLHSDEPVTYLRIGGTDDELARVAAAIRTKQDDFRLIAIRSTDGPGGEVRQLADRLWTCTIHKAGSGKPPEHDWQGNDEEWIAVLEAIA